MVRGIGVCSYALGNLPPLSFIDGAFLKYFGVPFALTWFMCQKTFDGKKPYGFLKSVLAYLVRPETDLCRKAREAEKGISGTAHHGSKE